MTVLVLKTTGTPLESTTPELAPALSLPPPPLPLTWASSRAYKCSRARFAPDPGRARSRVLIRTVSLAGSVMYVVTSRKPCLVSVEVTVQAMPVGSAATV